jgi:small neutral amino acid transporter SnatA (MarC family)
MMDMSSVIDASLAFGGALAVVLIGISMVSSESTTVSTSSEETGRQSDVEHDTPLQAAA